MKSTVFDIQRASFVDGDGVRTAVFFKGCSLRCKWCHNPEGIKREKELLYYQSRCTSCGKCNEVCKRAEGNCTLCGKCALYCPSDAKELCGRDYTVDELFEIIKRDKTFYEKTGGGVTFTGGECMLQIDFLVQMLKLCRENGINTAVDTAGNVPFGSFELALPYADTFLYDIKCINEELHISGTGHTNKLILDNFNRLLSLGASVTVRIPVIGGFNDTDEEMEAICTFLKGKKISGVELLPYHNLGAHKYEALGTEMSKYYVPTDEKMEKYRKIFKEI